MLSLGQTDASDGQLWRVVERKARQAQGFVAYLPPEREEAIAPAPEPIPDVLPRFAPKVTPVAPAVPGALFWLLAILVASGAAASIYGGTR